MATQSKVKPDFKGWATKYDVKCLDGLTLKHGSFAESDLKEVPIVWQHQSMDPFNVLGVMVLHHADEGLYGEGYFNNTELGQHAKELVQHGDIKAMSINAQVKRHGAMVVDGRVREVSLVISGKNPEALIDFIQHSDAGDGEIILESEIMHSDEFEEPVTEEPVTEEPVVEDDVQHGEGSTYQDILKTLTDEQLDVVAKILTKAFSEGEIKQGEDDMMQNTFDSKKKGSKNVLTTEDAANVFATAKKHGSFREVFIDYIQHSDMDEDVINDIVEHGVTNIEKLFPDYETIQNEPMIYKDINTGANQIYSAIKKIPFSRLKTTIADLTEDTARARGYITGEQKLDQVFDILTRSTDAQTIYIRQNIDRDQVIDITDFNIISFFKREMNVFLIEEIVRAVLVGDGRSTSSNDKIKESNIRPILTDDDMYAIKSSVAKIEDLRKGVIKGMKQYQGSGAPYMVLNPDLMSDLLLLQDGMGRDLYDSVEVMARKFRVKGFIESSFVPADKAIVVNFADYGLGADKGGEKKMFDHFDIDFNKYKTLMETRLSGALLRPKSALIMTVTELTPEEDGTAGQTSGE